MIVASGRLIEVGKFVKTGGDRSRNTVTNTVADVIWGLFNLLSEALTVSWKKNIVNSE